MTELLRERRLVSGATTPRGDLLVHALAQLPDEVVLALHTSGAERPRLEAMARAYGIESRIDFAGNGGGGSMPPFATMAELVEALSLPDDPPSGCARSGTTLHGQRVAVITNLPVPYRVPLFAAMHERLAAEGALLRVFFLAGSSERSWMNTTPEGFEYELLSSVRLPIRRRRPPLVPADLGRRLSGFRPTLVLAAGLSPLVAGRAGYFARQRDVPFGLWSGDIAAVRRAGGRFRRLQRQRLLALADFAVVYGFCAGEYLRSLRPELPLAYGRNTSVLVTEQRIERTAGPVELLLVGDPVSPAKGVDVAIAALRLAPELDCRLTVVGGGALEDELGRAAAADLRIGFTGALPPTDVRSLYATADALLFPTRADVFGLVLVEAMAAGLAAITASNPGVVGDLAVDGHNCLIVDGHDPVAWATAIGKLVEDRALRSQLGDAAARSVARRWTIAHSADAMLAGLRLGTESGRGGRG